MGIDVTFLKDGEKGQGTQVATQLVEFINAAKSSLHIAIYDFRLRDAQLRDPVIKALNDKAANGVKVRIAFYAGKPPTHTHRTKGKQQEAVATTEEEDIDFFIESGGDPAPKGTKEFLAEAFKDNVEIKSITGSKLMHDKYIIRDANTTDAALWTGSANFTDDAWSFQENNIIRVEGSPQFCAFYETDFQELWVSGDIKSTGVNDLGTVAVGQTSVEVAFAPGEGKTIDHIISTLIGSAKQRIKVASMVLTSQSILASLDEALRFQQVSEFGGIYDETQMSQIVKKWEKSPKDAAIVQTFQSVASALVGKRSHAYTPTGKHDFMHNKVVVCDDKVVTGSFNFSRSATQNAENSLVIQDQELADKYSAYIDELIKIYGKGTKKHS
jgi:phosphatidylserine/phosphatidylglycerophosphate/cardiolipin synthase-like enzyme